MASRQRKVVELYGKYVCRSRAPLIFAATFFCFGVGNFYVTSRKDKNVDVLDAVYYIYAPPFIGYFLGFFWPFAVPVIGCAAVASYLNYRDLKRKEKEGR